MERLLDRVLLAAHPESLHQPPRRLVVEEALRDNAAQAERAEAQADQRTGGLGGVAPAAEGRVEGPAELGLDILRLGGDLLLRPPVSNLEQQVADHPPVELDDEHIREPLLAEVALAVGGVRLRRRAQPVVYRGQFPEVPGRVEVVAGRPAQQQPLRANGPVNHVQGMAHRSTTRMSIARHCSPTPPASG
jgi:hypothetical protein